MKVLINGIGVAGPALAYWLTRSGHDVVLVEQSPQLRTGGYIVDFWGAGYDIAEKMGLIDEIRALGYQVREFRFVDRDGRKSGGFDVEVFGRITNHRFTSVKRSGISATIVRALPRSVEMIFGDSVADVDDRGDRLRVHFDRAAPRDVDLVVGADGLHSRVRSIVFGAETQFEVPLGYHVAAFEIDGYRPRDELVYVSHALPGRQISRFSIRDDKTLFLFVFRDKYLGGGDAKTIVRNAFAGAGWEWPRISEAMEQANGMYFDRISQIRMAEWTRGRTALIGDAAACVSLLAGEGTGLAILEAYMLAGELHECRDDVASAFARYQQRLMPFLHRKQESAARFASSFAPHTSFRIALRNAVTKLMRIPLVAEYFIGRDLRDDIALPQYRFS